MKSEKEPQPCLTPYPRIFSHPVESPGGLHDFVSKQEPGYRLARRRDPIRLTIYYTVRVVLHATVFFFFFSFIFRWCLFYRVKIQTLGTLSR